MCISVLTQGPQLVVSSLAVKVFHNLGVFSAPYSTVSADRQAEYCAVVLELSIWKACGPELFG